MSYQKQRLFHQSGNQLHTHLYENRQCDHNIIEDPIKGFFNISFVRHTFPLKYKCFYIIYNIFLYFLKKVSQRTSLSAYTLF